PLALLPRHAQRRVWIRVRRAGHLERVPLLVHQRQAHAERRVPDTVQRGPRPARGGEPTAQERLSHEHRPQGPSGQETPAEPHNYATPRRRDLIQSLGCGLPWGPYRPSEESTV